MKMKVKMSVRLFEVVNGSVYVCPSVCQYIQLCIHRVRALVELYKIEHKLLVKVRDTLHILGM